MNRIFVYLFITPHIGQISPIELFQVKLSEEETKPSRAKKNRNKFPCDHCDTSYQDEAKLVKHMFSKHPDKQVDVLKETSFEGKLDKIEESNLKDDYTERESIFVQKEEVRIFYY